MGEGEGGPYQLVKEDNHKEHIRTVGNGQKVSRPPKMCRATNNKEQNNEGSQRWKG